ncbi:hypothetical protein ACFSF0_07050 [Ottowia flava]|uniref:Uncharacterized protein n=1 Tax=Ottowia flava TaxID=2675430 RepID=A0ABW4KQK2_9BURK|nr:hypothetical protein [Ottowia sp. GY511]
MAGDAMPAIVEIGRAKNIRHLKECGGRPSKSCGGLNISTKKALAGVEQAQAATFFDTTV